MKLTTFLNNHYEEFPQVCAVIGFKPSKTTGAQQAVSERRTIVEISFFAGTIKIMRIDNGYKKEYSYGDKEYESFRKFAWKCVFSSKVLAVTFIIPEYFKSAKREEFEKMYGLCSVRNIPVDIICNGRKFKSTKEHAVYLQERRTSIEEFSVSVECVSLIIKHAKELLPYLKKGADVLIEVLRQQIKLSGYDVDMQSIYTTDGLNHGKIDDSKGQREWSRDYTKHYERYQQNLIDLLNMYISCKFYKQAGFEVETDGIGRRDTDSYTGGSLTTASPYEVMWNARHDYGKAIDFETASAYCAIYNMDIDDPVIKNREDDIVVPMSACSEYTQMYMN